MKKKLLSKFKHIFSLILFVIIFYFEGNTLYWKINGEFKPENFLKLQLNKKMPPDINQEPIKKIKYLKDEELIIYTKDKYWILHYEGNSIDWYVEDYKNIK